MEELFVEISSLIFADAAEESGGIAEALGDFFIKVFPNGVAFITQFIAFIILVLIGIKIGYKPVHKFIQNRKKYVEENLAQATSKNEEASKYLEESKASISKSKKEAVEIIQKANIEAEKIKADKIEETNKEIAAKHAKAQEDIRNEQEKAIKELHDEVVDLAFEATKSILDREVDKDDNKKLVDNFVDELMEKK